MKKLLLLSGILLSVQSNAAETIDVQSDNSQPTVIFGEAATAAGTYNEISVEQAADAQNPFGNPIVNIVQPNPTAVAKRNSKSDEKNPSPIIPSNFAQPENIVSQTSQQNPEISPQNSPQEMENEIQNTLYESQGRIYDLQSYPNDDINQIENQGNAVTNYPEY